MCGHIFFSKSNSNFSLLKTQQAVLLSRGKTSHLLIGDEFEYWNKSALQITISPQLERAGSVFIGISSAGKDGNFSKTLIHKRDKNGKRIVSLYLLEFVCRTCKETMDIETIINCRHMAMWIPRHKDLTEGARQDIISALWEGHEGKRVMESKGMLASDFAGPFHKFLPNMFDHPPIFVNHRNVERLVICVDPNFSATTTGSEFAVVSMAHYSNGARIVSTDGWQPNVGIESCLHLRHCNCLRKWIKRVE